MASPASLIALSRPRHWVKNAFVLMPVPFAVSSGAHLDARAFGLGLLGFCLVSSATYAFNDSLDAEADRNHPDKRQRPVAAGQVSVTGARLWSLVLLLAGVALAWAARRDGVLTLFAAYVAANLLYSLHGRRVALVDVFLLSSGYVIRVLLGCALVAAQASNWLLLCTSTLALFLALAKRRADLALGLDGRHRPSLSGYSAAFLDQAMVVMLAASLIAYALYCIEGGVLTRLAPGREFATLPFVVFGGLEYLRLVHSRGAGGSPVDVLLSSPRLLLCGAGWVAAALWSVGLWGVGGW
jgi:4-hydroxybenzoate polyprenyltransferase